MLEDTMCPGKDATLYSVDPILFYLHSQAQLSKIALHETN